MELQKNNTIRCWYNKNIAAKFAGISQTNARHSQTNARHSQTKDKSQTSARHSQTNLCM
jgi:hypothetical protein